MRLTCVCTSFATGAAEPVIRPAPPALKWLGLVALLAAVILPPFAGDYALTVLTDMAVLNPARLV